MNHKRTINPSTFPPLATALLMLGAFLHFLFPLIAHADTTTRGWGHAIVCTALAGGGLLAMRHYWAYDKPLFKRKAVLFALGVALLMGLYALTTHHTGAAAGIVSAK